MDYAHIETDKRIEELEKRLQAEYRQAYKETKGKLKKYLSDFARKDEAKRKLVEKGELSQADYKKWRTNQMLTGQRWTKMVDTLAKDMNRTNQIAADIINGQLFPTFALNANFAAYSIENGFQTDFGFTLYNEDTVNRLIEENPDLLPAPRVDISEDMRWNKQKITSNITQAVLQGKSIPEIAKTMQTVVGMNKASATRNARTAMTGAQNAGRQQAYDRAKAMGIKVKKEWVATLDGRTRHSHGMADGQQVELDGKFTVGRAKMRYPGDVQNGTPEEIYNCRCTMVTVEPDYILKGGEKPKNFEKWVEDKSTPAVKSKFVRAKTVEEAEEWARDNIFTGDYMAKISYKGIDVENANKINQALETVTMQYGKKLSGIEVVNPKTAKGLKQLGGNEDAVFATNSLTGVIYVNKNVVKNAKSLSDYNAKGKNAFDYVIKNKSKLSADKLKIAEIYEKAGKQLVDDSLEGLIIHEYGHFLNVQINPSSDIVSKIKSEMSEHIISGYSQFNVSEYLAECFVEYHRGNRNKLSPTVINLFKEAEKNG